MQKDYSFLAHLITEDIYVIEEKKVELVHSPAAHEETVVEQVSVQPEIKAPETGLDAETTIKVKEPATIYINPLPTAGNNLKNCIVCVESESEILEEGSRVFLENILKAVKRTMEDILLVNVREASNEQIEALLAEQNHRQLIGFGTSRLDKLKGLDLYSVTVSNHKTYLKAEALTSISSDQDKKKALWKALQEIFL